MGVWGRLNLHRCALCTLQFGRCICDPWLRLFGVPYWGNMFDGLGAYEHRPALYQSTFYQQSNILFLFLVSFAPFWNPRKIVKRVCRAALPSPMCTLHPVVRPTDVRFMAMPLGCPVSWAHVWQIGSMCTRTRMVAKYFLPIMKHIFSFFLSFSPHFGTP